MFPSISQLTRHLLDDLPDAVDWQGWNSDHEIFDLLVAETQPQTIIEVGTWKGRSAAHLARATQTAEIYCVDTWLGGIDHFLSSLPQDDLRRDEFGSPRLYHQFLRNFVDHPAAVRIHPIQQPSLNGARILAHQKISADLIYIDASHEYADVYADLCAYWPLLREHDHRCVLGHFTDGRPAPVMFGDDFRSFPGVFAAVIRFAHERELKLQEVAGNFWVLRRPA